MLAPKFQDFGSPKQRPWRTRTIVINGLLAFFATLAFYRYLHPGGLGFGGLGGLGCLGLANHPETPPSPMDVFQVYPPVRVGQDFLPALESTRPECSVVLMQHVFGWSYGKPFVGKLHSDRSTRVGFNARQGPMLPPSASGPTSSST